jgi:hypothetical protein
MQIMGHMVGVAVVSIYQKQSASKMRISKLKSSVIIMHTNNASIDVNIQQQRALSVLRHQACDDDSCTR